MDHDENYSDVSEPDSDDTIGDQETGFNPAGFFKHDVIDFFMPLKWLKGNFGDVKRRPKTILGEEEVYILHFPEEFVTAANHPIFIKILQFLKVKAVPEQTNHWKISAMEDTFCLNEKIRFITDLIKCNIETKKKQFFELKFEASILKKLKVFFMEAKQIRLEQEQEICLFPIDEKLQGVTKLMLCLELERRGANTWILPEMLLEPIDDKIDFLHDLVVSNINVNECMICHKWFQSLLKHLAKSMKCKNAYAVDDIMDLREIANEQSKRKEKEWKEAHKSELAIINAEKYQIEKEQLAAKYQKKKSEIREKQSSYYDRNRQKVGRKQAAYYQKNKAKIAEKYPKIREVREKKKQEEKEFKRLQGERDFFNNIWKPKIGRHRKNYGDAYLKMLDRYLMKCGEFHALLVPILDDIKQRIQIIYELTDKKLASIIKELQNATTFNDIKDVRTQFKDFWHPLEMEVEDDIYKSLQDISSVIEENFDCPRCAIVSNFTAICMKCFRKKKFDDVKKYSEYCQKQEK